MNNPKVSSRFTVSFLFLILACSPAEKPKAARANPLEGTWVISLTSKNAYFLQNTGPFTPFGFDFSPSDSVEVFCRPREGERYTTYKFAGDTLTIRGSDLKGWTKNRFSMTTDTLRLLRESDTLIYRRVNMDGFKIEPLKRLYVSAAAWSTIIGLTFNGDGSLEVMSNGYKSGKDSKLYEVDKIYKHNKSPIAFRKVSQSLQKLHFIAMSQPGRQLLDSAQQTCFDGARYSVLWESDSLKEVSYISCLYEFEFFQYSEYLIHKLQLENVPTRGAVYDSIFESPIFYCGHVWDSVNQSKQYTTSQQLYLAHYLRLGKRLERKPDQLPTTLINFCGDREYGKALRTNGRIFRIPTDKKVYYVDAGKDLLAALAATRKSPR